MLRRSKQQQVLRLIELHRSIYYVKCLFNHIETQLGCRRLSHHKRKCLPISISCRYRFPVWQQRARRGKSHQILFYSEFSQSKSGANYLANKAPEDRSCKFNHYLITSRQLADLRSGGISRANS